MSATTRYGGIGRIIADDGRNDWMARKDPSNPGYELNGEHVQRSRLRLDARKWLTSKILPKQYGDRTEVEAYGKDGRPLEPDRLRLTPGWGVPARAEI
jgi:hypothetical protein